MAFFLIKYAPKSEGENIRHKLFKLKSLTSILAESHEPGHTLKKALGPFELILLGVGVIIGAGIFATIGTAAAGDAPVTAEITSPGWFDVLDPTGAPALTVTGKVASRTSAITGIGAPQLTVGLISGGINTNVVPDRVKLRMDRRIVPEESPDPQPAAGPGPLRPPGP